MEEKVNCLVAKLESEKRIHDDSIKDLQCELNQVQQKNTALLTAKERVKFSFLWYKL